MKERKIIMKNSIYFTPNEKDIEYLKELENNKIALYPKVLTSCCGFGVRCYLTLHKDGCETNPIVDIKDVEFKNLSWSLTELQDRFNKFFNKYMGE
jgi:hypothetical protein